MIDNKIKKGLGRGLSSLLGDVPKKIETKEVTLYWGGPVEPEHIFFIHSSN